ncbi:putative surfeit locus protein 6 protein [Phaeoacremonium minimum UCRPA7]|uniref:Putative surfeit locus protein 6 protein n=1 Tax=Phaeoacremonium minimum (strain UCR-PA7) TaxID=1286976 RepID=R8BRM7_PHAM7|nr:putative surfeit locus protein 6 protein [Phaeoacremonium minimum UCRPA7]EOO02022.1 putative surfeit locus protein 6 protein [Phaeoacremonium minimum UCRPA7]
MERTPAAEMQFFKSRERGSQFLQNQWKAKKQTKEEAKAAKRGKLDPDSALNRNAKEVMDERARQKRKAQEIEEEEENQIAEQNDDNGGIDVDSDVNGIEREKPREGLKQKIADVEPNKKQKLSTSQEEEEPITLSTKQEKQLLRKQKKSEKRAEKKKTRTSDKNVDEVVADAAAHEEVPVSKTTKSKARKEAPAENINILPSKETDNDSAEDIDQAGEMQAIEISGLDGEGEVQELQTSSSESSPNSPTFDTEQTPNQATGEPASTTTSISSTVPPSERPRHIKIPADTTALRARLAAKIEALRAARKADNADGKPIRTRQELIESRRVKQAERKAHKKELRRQAKEIEEQKREEALLSARTSPGSIMSPLLSFGSPDDGSANHFAFGRVAFADGTQMSHDLSYVKDGSAKKKGPSDPKTALAKLEAQKKRVSHLDEDKRKEVLEKETWLAARKRAEGEKVRDDETLLKKAVKRKEKAKKKSEKEWKERAEGVGKAIKQRQQKREENIKKRRDEKLLGKAGKKGKKAVKKNRPGFEGTLRVGGKKR